MKQIDCRLKCYRSPSPDHRAIDRAVELIENAKNPLIIISAGANRKLITEYLQDLINQTGIYVIHIQMGKGVVT